jgi:hypothetical protein
MSRANVMSTASAPLTAPESEHLPKFCPPADEAAYWRDCERRGRAALFFIVAGCNAGTLHLAEIDPAAFWSVTWDATAGAMRFRLAMLFTKFNDCPYGVMSFHIRKWAQMTTAEREFICRHTPQMARATRERLAPMQERAQ